MSGEGSSRGSGISNAAELLGMPELGPEANLFAVIPLEDCPHLEAFVQPVPPQGISVRSPCADCGNIGENWICLSCYRVGCSRFVSGCGVSHGEAAFHPLALSFSDLSVWCYQCDAYIHNPALFQAKNAAHLDKFGIPAPQ